MSSQTGGYLTGTIQPFPGGVTLEQFIQQVIVGVSGYTAELVRPQWQSSPPKNPNLEINWISFGVQNTLKDANAWVGFRSGPNVRLERQEMVEVVMSFYGPQAEGGVSRFIDGLQLQQNLDGLRAGNMNFIGSNPIVRGPDLANGRWIERYSTSIVLSRKVVREYPIVSIASAHGTIHTVVASGEQLDIHWQTEGEE